MSTLTVTTVQTANGSTDLTLQTGNTSAAKIVIPASGSQITIPDLSISNNLTVSKNLTVSADNTTGGGIILSDDGDIVDNNDGFCSMRFSNGVRVFSGNKTGSAVITLSSNGNANVSSAVVSTNTFNLGTSSIAANGYSRLPNGLLMQWGSSPSIGQDSSGSVTFPIAFTTLYCIQITPRAPTNNGGGGADNITANSTTGFTISHGADGTATFYWMAIGV